MSDTVYLVDGDKLTAMKPSAPPDEDKLQDLIARYSNLISDDDDLLLVRREKAIADSEDGPGRWSIDHLFVTRDAIPVLVEVKRAVDTRLRREVVGQLLEYAANGAAHWGAADAAQAFAESCHSTGTAAEEVLTAFLDDYAKVEGFWDRVESNLRDGRIKMLIVADRIPHELARIIEFLNEQMRAEVQAIELRYFESSDGRLTLAPRTIGQTERTRAIKGGNERRGPISVEAWIERDIAERGVDVVSGVQRWLEIVHRLGGATAVASTQGSIVGMVTARDGKKRYLAHMNRPGNASIAFGWVYDFPGLASEETRQEFLDRFNEAIGPLTTANLKGAPSFPVERLNDPDRAKAFETVLGDFFAAALRDA